MPTKISGKLSSVETLSRKTGTDAQFTYDTITGNGPVSNGSTPTKGAVPARGSDPTGGTPAPDNSGTKNNAYIWNMAATKITGNG